ncbi:MAG: hypothetical protein HYV07_23895 [Deltaproteobacteria bacterium]|nr:hypothetical protein [Deltaproteobacteria bacterium]
MSLKIAERATQLNQTSTTSPRFDTGAASQALIQRLGSSKAALAKVIIARGGDPGMHVTAAEQRAAAAEIQGALGSKTPLSPTQLRDMDHWLNAYDATRHSVDAFEPRTTDGHAKAVARTIGREVMAGGVGVVTVGYSAAKAAAQNVGVDPMRLIPGQSFTGKGSTVSAPSLAEVAAGLRGALAGAFDPAR